MRRHSLMAGLLALAALAGFASGPASAQTPDEIIKRGKVVIAIDTTVPPYGMTPAITAAAIAALQQASQRLSVHLGADPATAAARLGG